MGLDVMGVVWMHLGLLELHKYTLWLNSLNLLETLITLFIFPLSPDKFNQTIPVVHDILSHFYNFHRPLFFLIHSQIGPYICKPGISLLLCDLKSCIFRFPNSIMNNHHNNHVSKCKDCNSSSYNK